MRIVLTVMMAATMVLGACTTYREQSDRSDAGESHAREAGRKAHEVANATEKALDKAGRKIEKAARDAQAGWKEAERDDRAKGGKP